MQVRLIGDVHGKFGYYKRLIKSIENSIQLGDMGVGFRDWPHGDFQPNPPYDAIKLGNHRFIRGNHDNPAVCKQQSYYIPDGTVEGDVMLIGGALSIDRAYRTEGFSWWADEELSIGELSDLVDLYVRTKPRVMLTHDCPESVVDQTLKAFNMERYNDPSRTRQAFQSMFDFHQPELWVHGHWHVRLDHVWGTTRFVCLEELGILDIEV